MYPLGDKAIQIKFANEPNIVVSNQIRNICTMLEKEKLKGICEWVPTYLSVTIYFNPYFISYFDLRDYIATLISKKAVHSKPLKRVISIPVCYEKEFAPDIEEIAKYHSITINDVIRLHTEFEYYVYMLGFTPGFPYLGGLNKKIATPRKKTPRAHVHEGSVGIAGEQTGIYPLTSPGGWQIIGRTPLKLFSPNKDYPVLLRAGDYLKFEAITYDQFHEIQKAVFQDQYELKVIEGDGCEK